MTPYELFCKAILIDKHWALGEDHIRSYLAHLLDADVAAMHKAWMEENESREDREPTPLYDVAEGTAFIKMEGLMTKKPHSMQPIFGGCSTVHVREAIRS